MVRAQTSGGWLPTFVPLLCLVFNSAAGVRGANPSEPP